MSNQPGSHPNPCRGISPTLGGGVRRGTARIMARDVISFCKAASAPSGAQICRERPRTLPQGQGSRGLLRGNSTPPLRYTHAHSCANTTPVYTSVHPLSSRFMHNYVHTHAHTRWSTTPRNTIQLHTPTPGSHTYSSLPRVQLTHSKNFMKGAREVVSSWGGAYRSRVPRAC